MRTIVSFLLFTLLIVGSAMAEKPRDKKLDAQAKEIVTDLKLQENMQTKVYNVLLQIQNRIEDIPLGSPKYKQLLEYVNQERLDMMNVLLHSPKKYKEYRAKYDPIAEQEMKKQLEKSQEYIRNNGTITEDNSENDLLKTESEESSED